MQTFLSNTSGTPDSQRPGWLNQSLMTNIHLDHHFCCSWCSNTASKWNGHLNLHAFGEASEILIFLWFFPYINDKLPQIPCV